MTTDVCVPISARADCVAAAQADIAEHHLTAPMVRHVGEGNFHACVLVDPNAPTTSRGPRRSTAGSWSAPSRMAAPAPARTASATARRDGLAGVEMMRTIKHTLDSHEIFNPGKVTG